MASSLVVSAVEGSIRSENGDAVESWLLRQVAADPLAPLCAAVVGPGGTGKSALLDAVAEQYAKAGIPVIRADATRSIALDDLTPDRVVLVDQAHELDGVVLDWLRDVAVQDGARLVVAYRPWPRPAGLVALGRALVRHKPPVMLGHLDRNRVIAKLTSRFGVQPPAAVVDLVLEQSDGLPTLVDLLATALQESGRYDPARPGDFVRPTHVSLSPAMTERLRYSIESLEPGAQSVLHALSVGAALDVDVLCRLLDAEPDAVVEWAEGARATGLVSDAGVVVPFIRSLLFKVIPVLRTRDLQQRLATVELDRGGSVLAAARQLLGSGATGARVAKVFEVAGDEAITTSAGLALQFYKAAITAGTPSKDLASRQAHAAALAGDLDQALALADQVVADPTLPGQHRGAAVAAAVLAHRGLLARSADLHLMLPAGSTGPSPVMAVAGLIGTGRLDEARALVAESPAEPTRAPTLFAGAESLMAQGMLTTIDGTTSAALSQLARAAVLLEPAGKTALLPDTPAALAAIVALQSGEFTVAESALTRAMKAKLGGRPAHTRHVLLLGWTAMVRGRFDLAHKVLKKVNGAGLTLEPRDELLASALAVGMARRENDLSELTVSWSRARNAIVRHPVDLFVLQPLGELAIAAARLGEREWVGPHLEEAQALLDELGNPVLWEAPMHWHGLHAEILAEQPAAAQQHAIALRDAAAGGNGYAEVLAFAAGSWLQVITGEFNPDAVQASARRLAGVGLGWEGTRLVSHAAARTTDRRVMATMLQCARTLQGVETDEERGEQVIDLTTPEGVTEVAQETVAPVVPEQDVAPAAESAEGRGVRNSGLLSDRELEVGQLILDGLTYKQIGSRLFISAKTVEHHVARMRTRLGAASRDELFGKLRVLLGTPGK